MSAGGETDLARLIAGMDPALDPVVYVFADVAADAPTPAEALMRFVEDEGVTLVLPREEAERLGLAHSFPCRRITLRIHSALEAVGFLAAVATRLAAAGIPSNAVSAFRHDHLFVPEDRAGEAMAALFGMAAEAR